ncbi:flagellar hook-associated protein FlgK [Aureimonas sp. AU12]|uniref:flagellar hook-associated protein FlgK n=1 Tax=Aureimonas sp. AU12 TaxID=1638161 RepID=UPI0007867BD6|nr:flagellar hook-associated protein FlgK [Aureimonas sp. AU12]
MTLSSALNTATSSLAATQTQTAIVSRNVANVNAAGATRKYANVVTGMDGRVEVRSVSQSQNSALFRNMLDTTSAVQASSVVAGGLDRISEVIGDTDAAGSPAALVAKLSDALQTYATTPGNQGFASAAVSAAQNLATGLNQASTTVDQIRRDADDELSLAADDMNKILGNIETLNRRIVSGTIGGTDVTDEVDKRDIEIAKLATYVGVNVQSRGDNDVVIYTDSGVTMFDRTARPVEFAKTYPLAPGQTGNVLRIDGTVVTGDNAYMGISTGKVAGLVELRDKATVTFQAQLDAVAGGLIAAFAETHTVAGTQTAGVFTDASFTGNLVTAADLAKPGLAGRISVAAAVIADPSKIRDGVDPTADAMAGSGAAGFSGRILKLQTALNAERTFTAAGADPKGSIAVFAASSMGWLQAQRAEKTADTDYQRTLLEKTQTTLSNETGIDLNTELTHLLDLQRSFQASSKIISTVDQMMAALLQSI